MKKLSLCFLSVLAVMHSFGQVGTAPIIGSDYLYVPCELTLADTGAVGTGIVWDYSSVTTDELSMDHLIFRTPTSTELASIPSAEFVVQSFGGETKMYASNADSMYIVGLYDQFDDIYVTYDNPAIEWLLPTSNNMTMHSDPFYFYYGGGADITIDGATTWFISGQGTLITPYQTYTNVKRASRYTENNAYTSGVFIFGTNAIEIVYFNDDMTIPLMSIYYDDFVDAVTTFVKHEEPTSAGIEDKSMETLLFYPNPATESINLHQQVESYSIISMDGKLITSGKNTGSIDLTALNAGTYILQLSSDQEIRSEKLVIR